MNEENTLKADQIKDLLSDLAEADEMDIALNIGLLVELQEQLDRHLPNSPVRWMNRLGDWISEASRRDILTHIASFQYLFKSLGAKLDLVSEAAEAAIKEGEIPE